MNDVIRPDLKGVKHEVVLYIESLERITEPLKGNGAVKFMSALNRKLGQLADQLDQSEFGELKMSDGEDKTLDRFLKLAVAGQTLTANFKTFLQEYGPQIREDESKALPVFERMVRGGKKQ
jgi:hypothetical protein